MRGVGGVAEAVAGKVRDCYLGQVLRRSPSDNKPPQQEVPGSDSPKQNSAWAVSRGTGAQFSAGVVYYLDDLFGDVFDAAVPRVHGYLVGNRGAVCDDLVGSQVMPDRQQ